MGQNLPGTLSLLSSTTRAGIAAAALAAALCGCTTSETVGAGDSAAPSAVRATKQNDPKGLLAKGGETASSGYVDPMVRSAASAEKPQDSGSMTAMVPEPSASEPASIGEIVTQPTGIRAGTVSIFSGTASAPVAEPESTSATLEPDASPARRIRPAAGSVFSTAPQHSADEGASPCGTDTEGQPVRC